MVHYCFHTDIGFYRLKSVVKTLPLHEKSKPVLPLVVESNLRMKYNAIQYNTIQYNTIQYKNLLRAICNIKNVIRRHGKL